MIALPILLLALAAPGDRPDWVDGDHLTGDWGGKRAELEDQGITLGLVYTTEGFVDALGPRHGPTLLGHIDVSLELDTARLGWWKGGKLYVLGQNDHGHGINELVGSANTISNLEDSQFTQVTELFFEQTWLDEKILVRLGKQDASRDFALSAYGSDFINNNFGMFPTAALPNYAATGLGAVLVVSPTSWLSTRAALFEGSPEVGSIGFDTAFRKGAGFVLAAGTSLIHKVGAIEGATSFSVWRQTRDDFPRNYNWGFMAQHDERYRNLIATARFSWAMPDRNLVTLYGGAALTWVGVGPRYDDSVGIGFGYLGISAPLLGSTGPGSEFFVEFFYKMKITHFLALQPTAQFIRSPGGDGPDALIAGLRVEMVL